VTLARTLLAALLWIGLPGAALGALACRRARPDDTADRFLGVALVGGLSVWLLGAEILAKVGELGEGVTWVVGGSLAAVAVVVLVGPGRAGLGAAFAPGERGTLLLAPAAALAGALPLLGHLVANRQTLAQPTPWYYWQQVRETVATRGVPEWSFEWARRVPFLDDYGAFTAGTALLATAGGNDQGIAAALAVQALTLAAAGLALFLLARVWGATRFAAAVAVIAFFALDVYVAKLSSFRPEASAYALAFLGACFARRWLDGRRPGDLVVTGLALLTLGQVHGIVWLFAICLVGATVLAGTRLAGGVRRALVTVGLLVGVVVGAWLLGGLVLGGHLSGFTKLGGLPEVQGGRDPTWVFQAQTAVPALTGAPPTIARIVQGSLKRGFLGLTWHWHAVAGALLLGALVVAAVTGDPKRRETATRCIVFVLAAYAAVLAVGAWFTVAWETYVPRRTGYGRLLQIVVVLLPITAAVAASLPSRPRTRVVATVAFAALAGAAFVHGLDRVDAYAAQRPADGRLGALRDLDLPRDSLILANSYTEGYLRSVVGAPGMIEGRAPYTQARLLDRANRLLGDARRFFASPSATRAIPGTGGHGERPTHVLVATDPSWVLGTLYVLPTDVDALDERRDLRLEQVGDGFRLYRVVEDEAATSASD
jgi:hypothetical protein